MNEFNPNTPILPQRPLGNKAQFQRSASQLQQSLSSIQRPLNLPNNAYFEDLNLQGPNGRPLTPEPITGPNTTSKLGDESCPGCVGKVAKDYDELEESTKWEDYDGIREVNETKQSENWRESDASLSMNWNSPSLTNLNTLYSYGNTSSPPLFLQQRGQELSRIPYLLQEQGRQSEMPAPERFGGFPTPRGTVVFSEESPVGASYPTVKLTYNPPIPYIDLSTCCWVQFYRRQLRPILRTWQTRQVNAANVYMVIKFLSGNRTTKKRTKKSQNPDGTFLTSASNTKKHWLLDVTDKGIEENDPCYAGSFGGKQNVLVDRPTFLINTLKNRPPSVIQLLDDIARAAAARRADFFGVQSIFEAKAYLFCKPQIKGFEDLQVFSAKPVYELTWQVEAWLGYNRNSDTFDRPIKPIAVSKQGKPVDSLPQGLKKEGLRTIPKPAYPDIVNGWE